MQKKLRRLLSVPFDLRLHIICIYRLSRFCYTKLPFGKGIATEGLRHFMRIYAGSEISHKAVIGRNLKLPHPLGIVIGEGVVIGDNVKLWQRVTIGSHGRKGEGMAYPVIGDHVRVFVGSTIIGGVKVGNHSTIGAHSLVLSDVEPGKTVAGSPAKPVN